MEIILSILFILIVSVVKSLTGDINIGNNNNVDYGDYSADSTRVNNVDVSELTVGNNVFMQRDTGAFMYYIKLLKLR